MKVLLVNTSERRGGAAVACNRLMRALNKLDGVEANMLVRDRDTADPHVFSVNTSCYNRLLNYGRFCWERLKIFLCNGFSRKTLFAVSTAATGINISTHQKLQEADIIHLHWINQGMLSLKGIRELLKSGKPIVWTMHDMWPCTAICHYSWECMNFYEECGKCPFLNSDRQNDLSNQVWKNKCYIKTSNIHLVTVSSWLAEQTRMSSLTKNLKVTVIPNVIDTSIFRPQEKMTIRRKYSFPIDKKIVLMGAVCLDNSIKGFQFLNEALNMLSQKRNDLLLFLFGTIKNKDLLLKNLRVPYVSFGLLNDNRQIAELYAIADVTVVPSYYETFGQTIIEAMACGCPVVSFNNSGQTDIIDHKVNGYLAEYKNPDDLANGIQWVLDNEDSPILSYACIKKVFENYTEEIIVQKYYSLYNQLLNAKE
ncbi:glycosyltransferase family 4 protein [Odoribacter lunatus]|uniref:glycosyltransferase family 4 protein n=1 Tax=Odoribacter lunatus TaxID=2941335 RepID=UPI00203DCD69|nr:glycosyltransferase family 4 protein [Odoribacter lunatus]